MRGFVFGLITASALVLAADKSSSGPDEVSLPENYQDEFLNYLDVDHLDRKRVRKMYVNREAHAAAVAGEDLPDGTLLIMEDHDATTDADGNLVWGDDGRLIALDAITNIFVMEKNAAWTTANGHWDYAWYLPDGSPRPDASFDGCFSCHANRADRDFTFTYWKFVSDRKR
ncbi:cytochrome P460 family protein [Chelativorans salis]|uniref:Cytochrome P460 family protein n=1 Tax=Chelativorans salis TaxID=2978478 RepID=A0ABT2LM06_9HYPH|nr:cytochrome P460 family protein [Chelativorans sp. EGI FJ00035]MCT7374698.1 cytochrome P460 family protein [Chelativorans sp. EGI FJ00035]